MYEYGLIYSRQAEISVRRTLSRGFGGGRTIPQRLPRPPFSFVPSTARFLFGGTKRKCGVGTVGSKSFHALTGRGQYAPSTRNRYLLYALVFFVGPCGAVLSLVGKYPKDGKRGVSNPPSCNSPQRLLKRRRARYSVQFGKSNDHKIVILFHIVSALLDCGKTRYGREWTPKRSVRRR